MSTFSAFDEVIGERGLFCALYADRGSHFWHTPKAGGKVDRDNPTQVGRALGQLGVALIAAYSPQARGRSERMFGTLQKRLPQEMRLERTMAGDNTLRYKNLVLQIPEDRHRHHNVKAKVQVHHYPDGTMAIFHGPRKLAVFDKNGQPNEDTDKLAA